MQEIIELRRELHKTPELGYKEFKTAKLISDYLKGLGVSVTEGVAKTGVVGFLDNGSERTLLFRADMDALPIHEENQVEYKSQIPGVMHACGHDVHMAIILGAARELMRRRNELNCNVKFVFQPAEEGIGGALPMIEQGVLENPMVDAALALHVWPDAEVGSIMLKKGGVMASPDEFELTIIGKGGHAAKPDDFLSPIETGAEFVVALKDVDVGEPLVLTVTRFSAGQNFNVVPDTAEIKGTFRTLSDEARKMAAKEIERVVKEVTLKYGVDYEMNLKFMYPPLINNPEIIDSVAKIAPKVVDMQKSEMTGEDFAYFAQKVPSAMILIGCANLEKGIQASLHSATFDVDEACIPVGVNLLVDFAISY